MPKSEVMAAGPGKRPSAIFAAESASRMKTAAGPVAPDEAKTPDTSPMRITIEQAHNGWSVNCSGAGMPYSNKPHVATGNEEALALVKEYMDSAAPEAESESEDAAAGDAEEDA